MITKNDLQPLYELGMSESEVQIYLTMLESGALTAQEVVRIANIKRPTVYYCLRQLEDRGLIHKTGSQAIERFQAEPPGKLLTMLLMKRQNLEMLETTVKNLIPQLTPANVSSEGIPKIIFYKGEEAMKQIIMETLYCRAGKIDYLTPNDNFFWQAGAAFGKNYVGERTGRGIKTRHLWEQPLPPNYMTNYRKGSEIRLLPTTMCGHFRTTTLIYDDTTMYISSKKSGYVLLVQSKEHRELMSAIFSTLWEASRPL